MGCNPLRLPWVSLLLQLCNKCRCNLENKRTNKACYEGVDTSQFIHVDINIIVDKKGLDTMQINCGLF